MTSRRNQCLPLISPITLNSLKQIKQRGLYNRPLFCHLFTGICHQTKCGNCLKLSLQTSIPWSNCKWYINKMTSIRLRNTIKLNHKASAFSKKMCLSAKQQVMTRNNVQRKGKKILIETMLHTLQTFNCIISPSVSYLLLVL